MIHNVQTILPCVVVYDCQHDFKDLVELIETESNKPWSYLPFMGGWSDDMETTSQFVSLGPAQDALSGAPGSPQESSLRRIAELHLSCNQILEDCLHDYLEYYSHPCSMDGGPCVFKITGKHRYSTPIDAPDNYYIISALMALTEVRIKLDRFETEFTVGPGDVYILPSQFPHEHSILGTPDSAYVLGKHLRA